MSEDELAALAAKIRSQIEEKGRYLVTQPAEVAQFSGKSDDSVREWAGAHGWGVVFHLDREQIEFFQAVPGQLV